MEIFLPRRQLRPAAWPYRPRPLPDELLTSYLLRVAAGLDLSPSRFLSAVWGSRQSLLNQDLDNFVPPHIAARIAAGTCIEIDDVASMTLAAYAGTLLVNHNPKGRNAWLLPTTVKSNDRRRRGLQFCPQCLTSDRIPYFRRRWRLAFVTMCTTHSILLRDGCPTCGEIVHPHRALSPTHCFRCGESLCAPTATAPRSEYLAWQRELELALERGWSFLGAEQIRTYVLAAIVRQIATLLVNGRRAGRLREAVCRQSGALASPFEKVTRRQPVEYLGLAERHRLFKMVQHLMQDWPTTFVEACHEAGIYRSHAIKDMPYSPFAYERVLRDHLDATPYYASEPEVAAAAAWLRRTKGTATYADLKAICGESRGAIYRHMDYQRRQKVLSRWRIKALSKALSGN